MLGSFESHIFDEQILQIMTKHLTSFRILYEYMNLLHLITYKIPNIFNIVYRILFFISAVKRIRLPNFLLIID
jgi:hypothetical protein